MQNYNNDAATRSFFEKHLDGFRFNEYLRGFAKGISGQKITYGDLVEGWKKAEKKRSEGKQEIGKQFEYNQFTRDFFAANSGGSRKEMMEACSRKQSPFHSRLKASFLRDLSYRRFCKTGFVKDSQATTKKEKHMFWFWLVSLPE